MRYQATEFYAGNVMKAVRSKAIDFQRSMKGLEVLRKICEKGGQTKKGDFGGLLRKKSKHDDIGLGERAK